MIHYRIPAPAADMGHGLRFGQMRLALFQAASQFKLVERYLQRPSQFAFVDGLGQVCERGGRPRAFKKCIVGKRSQVQAGMSKRSCRT